MEEKKVIKKSDALVFIVIVLIVAAAIGAVLSSSILDLLKALTTPITALLITPFVTGKLEEQKRKDTEERNRQEALKDYLKEMTTLLVDKHLGKLSSDTPITIAAKALTICVLQELDGRRNVQIIRFLWANNLIQKDSLTKLLVGVDLKGVDLSGANLSKVDLQAADLSNANLSKTFLCLANLKDAILKGADLKNANLTKADLERANLLETNVTASNLVGANLKDAELPEGLFSSRHCIIDWLEPTF
ncbi:MAG: pentapeptide repeat-containing protein [Pleurocapsa sp.]